MSRIKFQPGDLVVDLKTGQTATVLEIDHGIVTEPNPYGLGLVNFYGREPQYRIDTGWRYGAELEPPPKEPT
jgi:hypothetical protein